MAKLTNDYLFLFREPASGTDASAAEIQKTMTLFVEWINRLSENGILKGANPLEDRGRVIKGKDGSIITDGPFAESKEIVGGYFIISARSFEEASELAQDYPLFALNWSIEVREIAELCPLMKPLVESGQLSLSR